MLTETVFFPGRAWDVMVDSIKSKDIPMVLGSVIFLAIMFTVVNPGGRHHMRLCGPEN